MTDGPSKSEAAARQQRLRQQAEHRLVVQATMQAQRSGKLPKGPPARPLADAITAIVVLVVVIGMLVLMLRTGT